jgi:hypothetical protein
LGTKLRTGIQRFLAIAIGLYALFSLTSTISTSLRIVGAIRTAKHIDLHIIMVSIFLNVMKTNLCPQIYCAALRE